MAFILAGGAGERLSILAAERAKPAVPFGGKYRIIDFCLSNCANSGVHNVAVLTQFNPRSLAVHVGVGKPWDLDRATGGVVLLQPFLSHSGRDWYKGTADAVYQNLYYIEDRRVDEVLILAGDHVYTMRYDRLLTYHRSRDADVTVAVTEVPHSETSRFGIITLDHNERVISFEEKPKSAKSNLASMGIYVFNKKVLMECLEDDSKREGSHDFGKDILPQIIGRYKVHGYRFRGYWRDVGTVESYWQANMDLIVDLPDLNLYNPDLEVRTVYYNAPPTKLGPRAQVTRSLVANGAIVNGRVEDSVIFPRVFIEESAFVKDSIIFEDTTVNQGVVIDRSIIDKRVWVGPGACIGYSDDFTPNKEEPTHLNTGITLVGKGVKIPGEVKIGRNCKIECWVESADFDSEVIASGDTVVKKTPRAYSI
ncbi:MAG: glucose-1-phosphate adenylyltransferase [Chloroflexi bacterium]|nr:glucose-1-phosphate adenylyltransferase [Chloroflexota bacterium]